MGENIVMLEIKNLMVFYENMLAINNVSLKGDSGVVTGVFGANSAGKSTLMYTTSGIMLDIKNAADVLIPLHEPGFAAVETVTEKPASTAVD